MTNRKSAASVYDEDRNGRLLQLNWNRMSMLSRLERRTEAEDKEMSMRISFQNCFVDDAKVLRLIDMSLTPKLIKTIEAFERIGTKQSKKSKKRSN
jgi:hypothetical protein